MTIDKPGIAHMLIEWAGSVGSVPDLIEALRHEDLELRVKVLERMVRCPDLLEKKTSTSVDVSEEYAKQLFDAGVRYTARHAGFFATDDTVTQLFQQYLKDQRVTLIQPE